jgi:hypothetical protein
LGKRICPLVYKQGKNKCSIKGAGKVFAWINSHAKKEGCINIWFRGSAEATKRFTSLRIHARPNPGDAGGWEAYGGSFNIRTEKELTEAVELLSSISFPDSLR